MMLKLTGAFALIAIGVAVACSDDDGSDVVPKGPGMGGSAGSGMGGADGTDAGLGGSAGTGGIAGNGGSGGSAGGPPGCTPVDAGALDAGDAGDGDGGIADASSDGGISGVVSFAADIHPIFVASCVPCHAPPTMSGGHNVANDDVDAAYADAVEFSASILERTNGGGMPPSNAAPPNNCADGDGPGDPGCLSVQEYALIQAWVAQCFPR